MKINFSKEIHYTPNWNGNDKALDKFTVVLSVLSFNDFLLISDAFGKRDEKGDADSRAIISNAIPILPRYVQISGLEDNDGPVTPEKLFQYPIFMGLIMELMGKLMEISAPAKDDEKN